MRSPKKTKSTRRHCPIDIDCELVAAERGKICPNRNYCEDIAAPWPLPWHIYFLEDGTKVLEATNSEYLQDDSSKYSEQYRAGWCRGEYLPFKYVTLSNFPKPVLYVSAYMIHKNSGWATGKSLGEKYWQWVAVRSGISYLEFYEQDFYNKCFWDFKTLPIETNATHPHCILLPTY